MQLSTQKLSIGYTSGKTRKVVATDLTVDLPIGKVTALLGTNGAGKSTLIRTLAGLQSPLAGEILLDGKSLKRWKKPEIAEKLSVVLQEQVHYANLTVFELVALGRSPYTNWLGLLSESDRKIIRDSLEKGGASHLEKRNIARLSDGEWQKVMFCKTLAQNTPLILLDEPTSHLDVLGKIDLVDKLRKAAATEMKSILFSTHDLDLALRQADYVWLMDTSGVLVPGIPEDLVLAGHIERVYSTSNAGFDRNTGTIEIPHRFQTTTVKVTGSGTLRLWTERALVRCGHPLHRDEQTEATVTVSVSEERNRTTWTLKRNGTTTNLGSLEELLVALSGPV
jgi:iron complex transport system ATP-binding protein